MANNVSRPKEARGPDLEAKALGKTDKPRLSCEHKGRYLLLDVQRYGQLGTLVRGKLAVIDGEL
jgi:hypothetical protein